MEVEQFGEIALQSKTPAAIAARCTVFAESDLVHKAQIGYSQNRHHRRPLPRGGGQLPEQRGQGQKDRRALVFQGGVSKMPASRAAFEKETGLPVIVDPNGHLMGAFGVAILARPQRP